MTTPTGPQAQEAGELSAPPIGYIHEIVWPDGTSRAFSKNVPMLMTDVEKRDGIPTHHISERYWPIYAPEANPPARVVSDSDVEQALTDPENQPSQWGTIPLSFLPDRMDDSRDAFPLGEPDYEDGFAKGWNACLERISAALSTLQSGAEGMDGDAARLNALYRWFDSLKHSQAQTVADYMGLSHADVDNVGLFELVNAYMENEATALQPGQGVKNGR